MLGIVVVSYKNSGTTAEFISNQIPKINVPYVVVVVNNASSLNECKELAVACNATLVTNNLEISDNKYIIHSAENLGYAKGNNIGYKFLKKHFNINIILFSNDDIEIPNLQVASQLIDKLRSERTIGMIGPRVLGQTGKDQSPHYKPISIYRQIGWNLFPFLRGKIGNSRPMIESLPSEGYCYWVSGCFFMIRARDFDNVGGFDKRTFLYYEEAILAERLLQVGLKSYYYPTVSVTHYSSNSATKSIATTKQEHFLLESGCYYYEAYKRVPKALLMLWKLSVCVNKKLYK